MRAAATCLAVVQGRRLLPRLFFALVGQHNLGLTPAAAFGPERGHIAILSESYAVNPMPIQCTWYLGTNTSMQTGPSPALIIRAMANYFFFNFAAVHAGAASGRPPGVLRLVHARYMRQIPDSIWRF